MSEKTLVERLEDGYVDADRMPVTPMRTLLRLSIIEIEALTRERDEAVRERDEHKKRQGHWTAQAKELEEGLCTVIAERDALKAEVGRLKELISQTLLTRAPDYVEVMFPGWHERARAALSSGETTTEPR